MAQNARLSQVPCLRLSFRSAMMTWIPQRPSLGVVHLAQVEETFVKYIIESSNDYVKMFMKGKDSIIQGVFSLACGHSGMAEVRSRLSKKLPLTLAQSELVQTALQIWTITRLCEGGYFGCKSTSKEQPCY